jgi:peptide/nickel transport system ATP-binding protein
VSDRVVTTRGESPEGGVGPAGAQHRPAKVVALVSDLEVTFHRGRSPLYALRGVSVEVRAGEILGVVGESGSGKTVLGLSLLGLLPHDPEPDVRGKVDLLGTDMLGAPDRIRRETRRRSLGAVFQDPSTSLNPTMTVGRQIAEVAGSLEGAVRLLEAVGIPNPERRLHAYPHELSGGQQQRVMIAMAIARRPALIIADEPTTSLDVTLQSEILQLIARLRDDVGCSFVLITHDFGVAAEVADRIVVLYGGRVMEEGTSERVLRRPAHPYSIGLLASRLDLRTPRDRPVVSLAGDVPDPQRPSAGCPFAPRCWLVVDDCLTGTIMPVEVGEAEGLAACIRLDEAARLRQTLGEPERWRLPASNGDTTLSIQGVTKSFVGRGRSRHTVVDALREVDLDITGGESVALVGESGSGKTTLLRIVAGLEVADAGEVRVRGTPQMVFQDALASLTPWLSVRELVGERLSGQGLARTEISRRVIDALQRVGLPGQVAAARPRQLSGGQAQRVAIARAIVDTPKLLLADEPTSSLDVSLRAVILNLLNRLRRELGLSMLFVTHDLAAARIIADRVAVMHLGEIVEVGEAEQVCTRPAHPYTRRLLAALPGQTLVKRGGSRGNG